MITARSLIRKLEQGHYAGVWRDLQSNGVHLPARHWPRVAGEPDAAWASALARIASLPWTPEARHAARVAARRLARTRPANPALAHWLAQAASHAIERRPELASPELAEARAHWRTVAGTDPAFDGRPSASNAPAHRERQTASGRPAGRGRTARQPGPHPPAAPPRSAPRSPRRDGFLAPAAHERLRGRPRARGLTPRSRPTAPQDASPPLPLFQAATPRMIHPEADHDSIGARLP